MFPVLLLAIEDRSWVFRFHILEHQCFIGLSISFKLREVFLALRRWWIYSPAAARLYPSRKALELSCCRGAHDGFEVPQQITSHLRSRYFPDCREISATGFAPAARSC